MQVSKGIYPIPFTLSAADRPPLNVIFLGERQMDREDTQRYRLIAVREPTMSRENERNRVICLGGDNTDTSLDMQMDMKTEESGGTHIYMNESNSTWSVRMADEP
jgi:hypothetical protein